LATVRSLGVERAGTWNYASPDATARRLTGFIDVQFWTHDEPITFTPGEQLRTPAGAARQHPPEPPKPAITKAGPVGCAARFEGHHGTQQRRIWHLA
jgi:hypothetical protein